MQRGVNWTAGTHSVHSGELPRVQLANTKGCWAYPYSFISLFVYSFIRLVIHSFIHLFIYLFILFTVGHSPYSFFYSFIYLLISLSVCLSIHSFIYSFTYHSFCPQWDTPRVQLANTMDCCAKPLFICDLFIYSFVHLLIHFCYNSRLPEFRDSFEFQLSPKKYSRQICIISPSCFPCLKELLFGAKNFSSMKAGSVYGPNYRGVH